MLRFKEWDKLNYSVDESIKDDIKNWFSRNFGGKIEKIDSIISDLVSIESDFVKKWGDAQSQISDLKDQLDNSEEKSKRTEIKKSISEKSEKISDMEREKIQKIRDLNIRVIDISKGNQRIIKYWNLKKAEAEVDVSKKIYEISKELRNPELEDDLYRKYIEYNEALRKKEKEMDKLIPDKEIESSEETEEYGIEPRISDLLSLGNQEFIQEIRKYNSNQIKKIHKEIVDQKNMRLNELRSLRRRKSIDLDNAKGKLEKERIMKKYNPMIYNLGEIIDKIREKISYING